MGVPIDSNGAVKVTGTVTDTATTTALTDGTQKAIVRGAAKGVTTAADVTSTTVDADHQAHDVAEAFAPGAEDNTNNVIAVATRPLAVSTYAPSLYSNRGAAAAAAVKGAAGNVYAVTCANANAAVRYLQLHNKATAPVNPEVPLLEFKIPASSDIRIGAEFFSANGLHFSTGIAFGFSTTSGTYTAGTAGEQVTQVVYK